MLARKTAALIPLAPACQLEDVGEGLIKV